MRKISCVILILALLSCGLAATRECFALSGEASAVIDAHTGAFPAWTQSADFSSRINIDAEWYLLGAARLGYDGLSGAGPALRAALPSSNPVQRLKIALVLLATGVRPDDASLSAVLAENAGQRGIMSWVFALHLLHNGVTADGLSVESVSERLLSLRCGDGGWALSQSGASDVDVTAMTLQALAGCADSTKVEKAVSDALGLLSGRQNERGGFSSYGAENAESAAQVLIALSSLGVSLNDERFVKNGHTVLDALNGFRVGNDWTHVAGGKINIAATTQAMLALVSLELAQTGRSLYLLEKPTPTPTPTSTPTPAPTATPAAETPTNPVTPAPTSTPSTPPTPTTSGTPTATPAAETPTNPVTPAPTSTPSTPPTPTISGTPTATPEPDASATPASTPILTPTFTTPSATVPSAPTQQPAPLPTDNAGSSSAGGYKLIATLVTIGAALLTLLLLLLIKRFSSKNALAVLIAAAAILAFIWLTTFSSPQAYYTDAPRDGSVGTVKLAIRCDTVAGADDPYIPGDGVILADTDMPLYPEDTVRDVLVRAARRFSIQLDMTGEGELTYVRGIAYLYELDVRFGDLSGWIYQVNGRTPSVGCGAFALQAGDRVVWHYTIEQGRDIPEEASP